MPAVSGHLLPPSECGPRVTGGGEELRPQVWSVEREAEINEAAETVSLTGKGENMREDGPRAPTEPVGRVGSVDRVWAQSSHCGCGDGLKGGWCGRGRDGPSPRAPVYGAPGRVAAEGGAPGADGQSRLGTQEGLPQWSGRPHGESSSGRLPVRLLAVLLSLLCSFPLT